VGVADASEIIEEILRAHVSSSDETLFGNEFFEPLVKWVAQQTNSAHTVTTSDGEGVDVTITSDTAIMPIAVKSGVNVFNAASKKKQGENFATLSKRLHKLALHFDPIVGYCYGRKKQSSKSKVNFRELAGQVFWELITNEKDFYLRIVRLMGEKPIVHRPSFQLSFDHAKNRFVKEFLLDFSDENGAINWDKLLEFNSGSERPKMPKTPKKLKGAKSLIA
jgi:Type II restriction endonuclease EcoO109I